MSIFDSIDLSSSLDEIPAYQRSSIDELIADGLSEERVAELFLGQIGALNNAPFGAGTAGPSLFENFKSEINKFLCGSPEYDSLRNEVLDTWKKYKSGTVICISAGLGANLGVSAVFLAPAVALMLSISAKVGLQTWCATHKASSY